MLNIFIWLLFIISLTKSNDYYVFFSEYNKRRCRRIHEANVYERIDDNAYLTGKLYKNFLKYNGPNKKDGLLVDKYNCNCVRSASNKSASNEAFYPQLVALPNTKNKEQHKVFKKSIQPTRKRLYLNRNCRRLSRRAFRCRLMRTNDWNVKLKLLTYPCVAQLLFKYTLKRRRRRYRATTIKAFDGNRKLTAKVFKCFKAIPHERVIY